MTYFMTVQDEIGSKNGTQFRSPFLSEIISNLFRFLDANPGYEPHIELYRIGKTGKETLVDGWRQLRNRKP
jgi:hypothetical protein